MLCDPSLLIPDDYEPLLLTFHEVQFIDNAFVVGSDGAARLELDKTNIYSRDPQGELPTRFVNTSIAQLQSCINAHREYAESVSDNDGREAADTFAEAIRKIDRQCLADPENWWAVVVEQTRDGLL